MATNELVLTTLLEIKEDIGELRKAVESHGKLEPRVRALEHKQWWATGAAGAVAFIAAKIGLPLPLVK